MTEVDGRQERTYVFTEDAIGRHAVEVVSSRLGSATSNLTDAIQGFVLPRGYPHTVTPDYLPYQLWAVPSHITGWVSTALATSSLLKAVGVGAPTAVGATAAAASIKWITKDGIGAAGRLLVGGRLGAVFDEDPKRWRMTAEVFATLGLALEIATAFAPQQFLLLAGGGNFSKALGKGMGAPCFHAVRNHFAAANNVGDVAAKEQVWEVAAQLLGLAASVGVIKAIEATGHPGNVVQVWLGVQTLHVWLRYRSYACLRFAFLNHKRACIVAAADVAGRPVPGVEEANAAERILATPAMVRPRVDFGCTLEQACGTAPRAEQLQALLGAYKGEAYLLAWRGGRAAVVLRDGAGPTDLLRALWQAAWLDSQDIEDAAESKLMASVAAMRARFPSFLAALERAGWAAPAEAVIRSRQTRIRSSHD